MKNKYKKIKILHISSFKNTTPPKKYGGTERLVNYLCNYLTQKGLDVTVLRRSGSKGGVYKSINISSKTILKKTKELIDKTNPDIIHLHFKDKQLLRYLFEVKKPVIVTLYNNIRPNSYWVKILQSAPPHCFFTAISKNLKDRANYFSGTKRVVVTRPCYDILSNLKNKKNIEKEYFLYLGVIARYKSVLDIAKVFSRLKEKLLIVGPCNDINQASYFNEIVRYIKDFDNIKYLKETKSETEKVKIIQKSKAVVLATGYDKKERGCNEAFGLVMLESNSLGVPVLGYDQGNISDYVKDYVNGLKFKNKKEFCSDIKIISNSNFQWRKKCTKRAMGFLPNDVVLDYIRLYKNIILDNKT